MNHVIARTVLVALLVSIVPAGGALATASDGPANVGTQVSQVAQVSPVAQVSQVTQAAPSAMQAAQPITAPVAFPAELAATDTGTMILVALLLMLWIASRRPQR